MSSLCSLAAIEPARLRPILEHERGLWLRTLGWELTPSAELIADSLKAGRIEGLACLARERVVAYAYYMGSQKLSMIGSIHGLPESERLQGVTRVVEGTLDQLIDRLRSRRVESQFIFFGGEPIEAVFESFGFRSYARRFLGCELARLAAGLGREPALEVRRLSSVPLRTASQIIHASFAGGIDRELSACYESQRGCERFLEGVVHRQGCGLSLPDASFVAYRQGSPAGLIATSRIGPGSAHVVQLSVSPEHQGQGVGRGLLSQALLSLQRQGFRRLTLSVTVANRLACDWYQRLGFETIKSFNAYVWPAEPLARVESSRSAVSRAR